MGTQRGDGGGSSPAVALQAAPALVALCHLQPRGAHPGDVGMRGTPGSSWLSSDPCRGDVVIRAVPSCAVPGCAMLSTAAGAHGMPGPRGMVSPRPSWAVSPSSWPDATRQIPGEGRAVGRDHSLSVPSVVGMIHQGGPGGQADPWNCVLVGVPVLASTSAQLYRWPGVPSGLSAPGWGDS